MNRLLALIYTCLAVLGVAWFVHPGPIRAPASAVQPPRGDAPSAMSPPVDMGAARRPRVPGQETDSAMAASGAVATTGAIVFRVRDRAGRPASDSDWRLVATAGPVSLTQKRDRERFAGKGGLRARADLLGYVRFSGLPPRRWVLVPQLDGVTAPLLPVAAGASGVESLAGETVLVELEVERAVTLHGVVLHADGRSETAWLRATSLSAGAPHMASTIDAHTDEDGTFRVFSRPGRVRLETQPVSGGTILGEAVRPAAAIIELPEGSSHRFRLVYGAGDLTVVGSVVDQDGAPWAGLRAILRSVSRQQDGAVASFGTPIGDCTVDDDGRFEFLRVPGGSYTVSFQHPGSRSPAKGGIAEYPVPASFECGGAGRVDVGTSLVYRWRNVRVEGQVVVSDERAPQTLRLRVEVPPWNRITENASTRPVVQSAQIGADGRFSFDYSAHLAGVVTYVLEGARGESRTPVPFGVGDGSLHAVTLVYP